MNATLIDLRKMRRDMDYIFIDSRFFIDKPDYSDEEVERRLASSYGPNITIEMHGGVLAPPLQHGNKVYGLHEVEVGKNNRFRITDSWLTSYPVEEEKDMREIIKRANEILSKISNEEYFIFCGKDSTDKTMKIGGLDKPEFYFG